MSKTASLSNKSNTVEPSLVGVFQSGMAQPFFPEIHAYPVSRSVGRYLDYLETGHYPRPAGITQGQWSGMSRFKRRQAGMEELREIEKKVQGLTLQQMTAFIKWCGSDDAAVAWAARTSELKPAS